MLDTNRLARRSTTEWLLSGVFQFCVVYLCMTINALGTFIGVALICAWDSRQARKQELGTIESKFLAR